MPAAIRTIIIDFFGVVVSFDEAILYRKIASACRDPGSAFAALRGLPSTPSLIEGRTTLEEVHEKLVDELGLSLSFQSFHELWLQPYSAPMTDFASLLEELGGQSRLVLLSNVDRYYFEAIRRLHPELRHFAAQLVSYEMGFSKPSARAFHAALHAAEALAQECFFLDDKPENIDAARSLGIRGHVFTTTHACRATLARIGLLAQRSDA